MTKDMLEDHQHQMNWERGQIDYLGVDSFDNILRKIDTVISQKEEEPVEEPVEAAAVAAPVAASAPPQVQPPVIRPRPPPVAGVTDREEMFVRGAPGRKREVISNAQLEECKGSPSKRAARRPRPKPMRGRGQQDHRERYVRQPSTRSQQRFSDAELQAASSSGRRS